MRACVRATGKFCRIYNRHTNGASHARELWYKWALFPGGCRAVSVNALAVRCRRLSDAG